MRGQHNGGGVEFFLNQFDRLEYVNIRIEVDDFIYTQRKQILQKRGLYAGIQLHDIVLECQREKSWRAEPFDFQDVNPRIPGYKLFRKPIDHEEIELVVRMGV